ncbi:GntR family transcriptional regulator [Salinarimonas ramus]|uniref:GntR family transcriptional regulator n=1 Tax=Salinarimonas ramus TaxID=690164 RepID=A0A917Q4F2_9HYPH|nr:GntR family transcriptional regulator [Salinarimonas ramus]GGK21812.1 GntR family transcriptional regulator [Salinarimonas ramus]
MSDVIHETELRSLLEAGRTLDFSRSAASQIYEWLYAALVRMRLTPGMRLSEVETARALDASRTPVREAFIRLAEAGLIEVRPHRGTFVAKLDRRRILEARFIREALEVAVVTRLAEQGAAQGEEGALRAARDLLARMKQLAQARDSLAFNEADDRFHQVLAEATGYGRIAALVKAEEAHGVRIRVLSLKRDETYARIIREHTAILDAIDARDPQAATAAVRAHLNNIHGFIAEAFGAHPDYFTDDA